MSRPSKIEARQLEALEGISALLDEAMDICGIVAVRLRQASRQEPRLISVLNPANQQLAHIVDNCDCAHELIKEILAQAQICRAGKKHLTVAD